MNKRQTRMFAIICTAFASLLFLGLTLHSHTQFDRLTNAENITAEVTHGMNAWHRNNCINCHTLFGEGAYYAPDLTKITKLRGEAYLTAYMKDPSQFYDEQKHRRLMPRQDLSEEDIAGIIAFLDWVSEVDNQGWPPRPILVTGATLPGTTMTTAQQTSDDKIVPGTETAPPGARPTTAGNDPIALGETLFRTATPACVACHSIAPGVDMAGPSLAGISERAQRLLGTPEYTGSATDVEGFIRESIVDPSAYLEPGAMYSANGVSFMPNTYAESLTAEEIDHLVAYLATLR